MTNVCIMPNFRGEDRGDGGIRRVVEAQKKHLPAYNYNVVDSPEQADIIATHGVIQSHVTSVPIVNHCHGAYWRELNWSRWHLEANEDVLKAIKQSAVSTAPSEWVARILRRGLMREIPVLYHGIDPSDFDVSITPGDYVLWNKNRPDPICDPYVPLKLAELAPNTKFISTFGPRMYDNPPPNMQLTGRIPYSEAKKLVNNAAVYLCSARETFGIGTLEAMACAVPVLGFNWGGQREIIEHKVTGWLAAPGDFDGLLEGLRYCLQNKKKIGRAARAHVLKNFDWKKRIADYASLYDRVLAQAADAAKSPRVSVIITCFNLAELLPRAVASVARNNYDSYEIIIVNDASPDNTREIADKIAGLNSRVKCLHLETNQYLAGALNAGISMARGKYILPLDADNEIADNALYTLAGALDAAPEIDIAYGAMEVVESDNRRWISDWPPANFDFRAQIHHRNQITSTAMYRREVWERTGGYRRRCRTAEDADFWCRVTSFGAEPKRVTEAPMLIYHNRPNSMSNSVADWPWHEWYPWYNKQGLTPVARDSSNFNTHEPVAITVIIPVGPGHQELVIDAIDSVVAQTFTRWDVIVVNDSGSDLGWIHPFVRVINTGGNKGPAAARNAGINACSSRLWLPLDADDYLQPEALALLYENWEPGHYVYSDWIVAETGEIKQTPEYDCKEITRQLTHAVTALYEREAWEKVGGFDATIDAWEDWDFVLALASKGYCGIRVPVPLLNYRVHAGKRREEQYARREEIKHNLAKKWHKYLIEGEPLMACGGCGRQVRPAPPAYVPGAIPQPTDSDMILVEFTGIGAARTFRGRGTGTSYRFGADPTNKVRYVFKQDLEMFEERPDEFRKLQANGKAELMPSAPLQAAGPPRR